MMRNPAALGMFYPSDRKKLESQLKGFFSETKEDNCRAVISPHAGYIYSGQGAAHAIASLKKSKSFVILGPNHTGLGKRFSVFPEGGWRTPFGDVRINSGLAKKLLECQHLEEDTMAHMNEHSIEVQLPFLQYKFKEFDFVPICVMGLEYSDRLLDVCKGIADAVAKTNATVIVSSDFSHFLSLEESNEKDNMALEKIKKLDPEGFFETLDRIDASICGYASIAVLLFLAKKLGLKPDIIHKSNSGEVSGDYNRVVTYYAIGFR